MYEIIKELELDVYITTPIKLSGATPMERETTFFCKAASENEDGKKKRLLLSQPVCLIDREIGVCLNKQKLRQKHTCLMIPKPLLN